MSEATKPRRKPSTSPTQRARAELKRRGWPSAIVEHFNPHVRIRQDLWGVFDLLAIRPPENVVGHHPVYTTITAQIHLPAAILGIQVTTNTNRAARRDKLKAWPLLAAWCATGALVELWTYSKMGKRGERKLWTLQTERIVP